MTECVLITGIGLTYLGTLRHLRFLNLDECNLSDDDINKYILPNDKFAALEHINLHCTNTTRASNILMKRKGAKVADDYAFEDLELYENDKDTIDLVHHFVN